MMAKTKQTFANGMLLTITMLLVAVGIAIVYDASYAIAGQDYSDPGYYFKRQALFAVIGVIGMFVVSRIPHWKLRRLAPYLLGVAVLLSLLVLVIGIEVNGAKRWLPLGPIRVQPSEFTKLALVLYLANVLPGKLKRLRDVGTLIVLLIPVGIAILPVVKEDMGTAIVMVVATMIMLFAAGVKKSHLWGFMGFGLMAAYVMILIEPYRMERIRAYFDPFRYYDHIGFQVCQSLIALGSGGIFGMGFGDGKAKLFYLPAAHTDFIFAVVGQEMGLIGASVLALMFLGFIFCSISIANSAKDISGKLIAIGIGSIIGVQALMNMLVVTAAVPDTGVPLPFISAGGSSLVMYLACVGVLMSVSQYPKESNEYERKNRSVRRRNGRSRVSRY